MRSAGLLASGYALVAGTYILVSSTVATEALAAVEDVRRIEVAKGVAFVLVTALLLFLGTLVLLRREARHRARLVRAQHALLAADRRAEAGVLAASVAHDLKNALSVLRMGLDELRELDREGEVTADMASALDQAAELSGRLSRAGRDTGLGAAVDGDLASVVRQATELAALHPSVRRSVVRIDAPEPVAVRVYPVLVSQMISNLVINAAEAAGRGGVIETRARKLEAGAVLEVHDDGPGIAADQRARLFEPFYTTKPQGTGLGLLSVRLCAELHDGEVEIGDSPLGGAMFRVTLRTPVALGMP